MKKKQRWLLLFAALVATLVFFIAIVYWWSWANQPVSSLKPAPLQTFVIPRGESLTSIANRLKTEGLVKSSLAFKILVLNKGQAKSIQAGDFRLRPSSPPEEIAYILAQGSSDLWLTFPEGWRREEIGRRLTANLKDFSYSEFINLTNDLEGYLFPDTYLIPAEASSSAVIKIFERNFNKKFSIKLEAEVKEKNLTKKQVIILASIVEREARYNHDRLLIAGILLKRWQRNWPLQADATIQYVIGGEKCGWEMRSESAVPADRQGNESGKCDWWESVKKADLEIDSPYNTYKYRGLPPTSICNPGLASIEAVVYPQESDYWFYLSDSSGAIHFAKTNEEHNENIRKYLR